MALSTNALPITGNEYAEIMNLYALYSQASDSHDAEIFASCFTVDGELRNSAAGLHLSGREELRALRTRLANANPNMYRRHWNSSIHLRRADSSTIYGRCYFILYTGIHGAIPDIAAAAVYEDVIASTDEWWKFRTRILLADSGNFVGQHDQK